ncbi:hypothetical protein ACIGXM_05965 [Kitasatospora sp. NPDC052896]|uniref:hypothetical protein n=1 Tax=Kitasatospora sp. NPDC052896 TaxID=3364061 RepID=UPI0037C8001B
MSTQREIAAAVRALVADLLPVLAPHAMLDADSGRLVLLVDAAHADVSLDGIVAICADLPQHTWPSRVQDWLAEKRRQVAEAVRERRELGEVETLLRVQVAPRLPAAERRRLLCTAYGELLDLVVVLDHADGGRLSRERAERLVLADPGGHALANTLRIELPAFTLAERPPAGGAPVWAVGRAGSPFATSALLGLDRFLPGPCPYGVLLGLPRYGELLLCPVVPDQLAVAARELAEQVGEAHRVAADRCDERLFWWAEERLYELRFGRLTGRPKVPAPLRRLLRGRGR